MLGVHRAAPERTNLVAVWQRLSASGERDRYAAPVVRKGVFGVLSFVCSVFRKNIIGESKLHPIVLGCLICWEQIFNSEFLKRDVIGSSERRDR
jgi:hypothetical protein